MNSVERIIPARAGDRLPRYRRFRAAFILSLSASWLLACDSTNVGQTAETSDPLRLVRIMVQDWDVAGGRNLATDLLEKSPKLACDLQDPCPAGSPATNPPCPGDVGTCPDPLDPAETPPAIGTVTDVRGGSNSIRLVFNRLLDPGISAALQDPRSRILEFADGKGAALASTIIYDPSGSPFVSSNIFGDPLGPAIVIRPRAPLVALGKYSVRLLAAARIVDKITDKSDAAIPGGLGLDAWGPIRSSYDFQMEALYPLAVSAVPDASGPGVVAANDVIVINTNSNVDPASVSVTVRRDGAMVLAQAFVDQGSPPACSLNLSQIEIAAVSAPGVAATWKPGSYTYVLVAADAATGAPLTADAFGSAPLSRGFRVTDAAPADPAKDNNAVENFLLPGACKPPSPKDGGA